MDTMAVTCPGCGLELPDAPGVYDGYYTVSPQCRSLHQERELAELSLPVSA